jgi:hypothetical protein
MVCLPSETAGTKLGGTQSELLRNAYPTWEYPVEPWMRFFIGSEAPRITYAIVRPDCIRLRVPAACVCGSVKPNASTKTDKQG